jgi:hypothetical protein
MLLLKSGEAISVPLTSCWLLSAHLSRSSSSDGSIYFVPSYDVNVLFSLYTIGARVPWGIKELPSVSMSL